MKEGDIIEGGFWDGAEVISVYTRAQAIEDGVLADVTGVAREAGFTVPVALTAAVWALVEPTEREREEYLQDVQGRLWDVLWMAFLAARRGSGTETLFRVAFQMRGRPEYGGAGLKEIVLKLHSGPGDEGEHVITLMLPQED